MSNLNLEKCSNHLMQWEKIEQDSNSDRHTYRAKVFGGWMVRFLSNSRPVEIQYIFLPDKNHSWGKAEAE